jgi:hypothetical protein
MQYDEELYKQKLNEFFDRRDPSKKSIVDKIVEKFPNKQDTVFKYLSALYAKKDGVEDITISEDTIFNVPMGPNTGIA